MVTTISGMAADRSSSEVIPDEVLRQCLLAAAAAPSVHNTQPWGFQPHQNGVDVYVDPGRQLATLDPLGREMYVSVGAAILNLRVALRAHGWPTDVQLMPDPAISDLAAHVLVQACKPATQDELALAQAIRLRHTNRKPFSDTPVPEQTLSELAEAAKAERGMLTIAEGATRDGVLSLIRTADNRLRRNASYLEELAAWTNRPGIGHDDGVPREAFGPRDTNAALPLRDLALGTNAPTSVVDFEPDPLLVLLYTRGDDQTAWLHGGAALQRVWLTATVHGLSATPLTQVTEVPALRRLLAISASGWSVQSVLRLGYPAHPAGSSPRRPIDDVLMPQPDDAQ
jgi:nitroreductase